MTDSTIKPLVETKRTVILQVEKKELKVKEACQLLHPSRVGLWKLRRSYRQFGSLALTGRKRGPKRYFRVWNRTGKTIEVLVVSLFYQYGVGPDRLVWLLEEKNLKLSRITVYRILVRKKALLPKLKGKRLPPKLYVKGCPGEEVQIDATEPFGKGHGWSIATVGDFSRWAYARLPLKNNSRLSARFLEELTNICPYRLRAVRVDNGPEFQKDFIRMAKRLNLQIIRHPPRTPTAVDLFGFFV